MSQEQLFENNGAPSYSDFLRVVLSSCQLSVISGPLLHFSLKCRSEAIINFFRSKKASKVNGREKFDQVCNSNPSQCDNVIKGNF